MPFCYSPFLSFELADPAGVLFFGHVFTLAHQAYEQFVIQELEIPWDEWFSNPEWGVPIKHAEATYHAPLFAGKLCTIDVQVEEVKHSSFSLLYSMYQEEVLCCMVKTVHVFCDSHTKLKQSIPSPIEGKLKEKISMSIT